MTTPTLPTPSTPATPANNAPRTSDESTRACHPRPGVMRRRPHGRGRLAVFLAGLLVGAVAMVLTLPQWKADLVSPDAAAQAVAGLWQRARATLGFAAEDRIGPEATDTGSKGDAPANSATPALPGASTLAAGPGLFGTPQAQAIPSDPNVIADVSERSVASVVNISSTRVSRGGPEGQINPFEFFFGPQFGPNGPQGPHGQNPFGHGPRERREQSLGSGVIVDASGVILTNNHVIEKTEDIKVTLSDGRSFDATIAGADPSSDIAVLKLKDPPKDLKPLPVGDSAKLRLGEFVLAIGNPFGLGHSVSLGIVSAKGRANVGITDYEDFIQTDAAINPGNSGGALVNLRGELVGVNSAILSRSGGNQGIGFAIPSNMAKSVMDSLLKNGRVIRGWLGVMIQDVNEDIAEAMKLPVNKGVLVSDVVADGPAKKAGVERGDVVTKVNGEPVDSSGKLRNLIAMSGVAGKAKLEIIRKGETKTIDVTLGELPQGMAKGGPGGGGDSGAGGVEAGGLALVRLSPPVREKFEIPASVQHGVVVTDVKGDSAAARAGIRPGDVILEANGQRLAEPAQFEKIYSGPESRTVLLVFRQGGTIFVVLKKK
jgi:serine protease Do